MTTKSLQGPVIVMMRHASIVDNLLPAGLVSLPHRIRLRYVLKKELLWDPVLDIGGQRLPNVFVRREGDSATEITRIRRLAIGLTERDGVLIYPEGTRFTAKKRDQAIRRLERTDPRWPIGRDSSAGYCHRDRVVPYPCSTREQMW